MIEKYHVERQAKLELARKKNNSSISGSVRMSMAEQLDSSIFMPFIETPEQLYNYYKTMASPLDIYHIKKDLHRTDLGNADWMVDPETGSNSLFNVLKAQTNYFSELGYSQGMGFVVSWILRHTK